MKKLIFILFLFPTLLFSQFENRTHVLGGANIKISTDTLYQLYDSYVVGAESIFGFRPGKFFFGVGAGAQYSGSDYHVLRDSLGTELEKITFQNIDIPIFIDVTYGKKFYIEAKLGYAVKLSNIEDYLEIQTHTLFNSLGIGYSIPLSKKVYLDLALEGKFDYLFVNAVSEDYSSIYFMPLLKAGFRFTKSLNKD